MNPVLMKKMPEEELENINLKSRFMLIADMGAPNTLEDAQPTPHSIPRSR